MRDNSNINEKKKIDKKEVRNIAISGATGGVMGAVKGTGGVAVNNYKSYNKIKKAYIDSNINEYVATGMSRKEAYRHLLEKFSKKKVPLSKIIPDYTGVNKYTVADSYRIKALAEMPYKVIGGVAAGVPLGILAYGQASNLVKKIDKKASNNMIYFEKVTK